MTLLNTSPDMIVYFTLGNENGAKPVSFLILSGQQIKIDLDPLQMENFRACQQQARYQSEIAPILKIS